eukprot:505565_1
MGNLYTDESNNKGTLSSTTLESKNAYETVKTNENDKFIDDENEDDGICEVCVTGSDERRRIWHCSARKEDDIVKCIGRLRIRYNKQFKPHRVKAGTGTIFAVNNDNCYILTAAHNIRGAIYRCRNPSCVSNGILSMVKTCDKCGTSRRKQKPPQRAEEIVFERRGITKETFGEHEQEYECDLKQILFEKHLEQYDKLSVTTSGNDICILVIHNESAANYYRNKCKNIYLVNNLNLFINEYRCLSIFGYPGDKKKGEEMWGMSTPKGIQLSCGFNTKSSKLYLINDQIDTMKGQSGSSIYCLGDAKSGIFFFSENTIWICSVHTGGSKKYAQNYGTLLDINMLNWVKQCFDDINIDIKCKIINKISYQSFIYKQALKLDGEMKYEENEKSLMMILKEAREYGNLIEYFTQSETVINCYKKAIDGKNVKFNKVNKNEYLLLVLLISLSKKKKKENANEYHHLYAISNTNHKLLEECDPGYHKELYLSIHMLTNNIKIGIVEHAEYNRRYAYVFSIDYKLQRFLITKYFTWYGTRSDDRDSGKIIFQPNNSQIDNQQFVTMKLDVNEWKLYIYCNNSETISIKVKENINYTPIILFNHNNDDNTADNKPQVGEAEIIACHTSVIKDTELPIIYDPHDAIIHVVGNVSFFLRTNYRNPKTILSQLWKGKQLIYLGSYKNITELIKEIKYLSQHSNIISSHYNYGYRHSTQTSIKMNAFNAGCDEFNQYAVDLWIYIEIYQYFKKQFYTLIYNECCDIQSKHKQIIPIIMHYLMDNLDNDYKQYTANDNEYLKQIIQLYTHKNIVWYRHIDEKFVDCFNVIHWLNNIDKQEKIEIINVIASYMMDCFTGKNIKTAKLITGYQFSTAIYSDINIKPRPDSFYKWMDKKIIPDLKEKIDCKYFVENEYKQHEHYDEKNSTTKLDPYWYCACCRHAACSESRVYQCDPREVCVYPDKTVNLWTNGYIKRKFNDKRGKISKYHSKIKRKMKKLKVKRKRQNWISYVKKKSYI